MLPISLPMLFLSYTAAKTTENFAVKTVFKFVPIITLTYSWTMVVVDVRVSPPSFSPLVPCEHNVVRDRKHGRRGCDDRWKRATHACFANQLSHTTFNAAGML